jgi:ubiquinone/menaquinone biosynthesis C-methylase UbiE
MINNHEIKKALNTGENISKPPQGIPTIESYNELLKSRLFLEMEDFSNLFLELNKHALTEYSQKWVSDPLHQWSRQWEYPFVHTNILDYYYPKQSKNTDIKILDAGSGITFFPYYLTSTLAHAKVDCCDIDASLLELIFSEINANSKFPVDSYSADLHHLPSEDNSYDIVYCISVLEHTEDFEIIIQEFKRILKQKGLLIMTFDISIAGSLGISRQRAVELIETLEKYFHNTKDFNSKQALKLLYDEERILTTKYIRTIDKNLLPPRKYSLLSTFKNILKFRNSKEFENLTVFCEVLRKE